MYYPLRINRAIVVDVKIKPITSASGDPMIRAIGTVWDGQGHQYLEYGTITSKAQLAKNESMAINDLLRQAEQRYLAMHGTDPATEEDMQRAFEAVQDAVNDGLRLRPSWRALTTNNQKLTHFALHGLPYLKQFADATKRKYLATDKEDLLQSLIAASMRQNGGNEQVARRAAEDRLDDYAIIYSHMRDQDERLPDIQLKPDTRTPRLPAPEQIKHLVRTVLTAFYRRVSELPSVDPHFALFCVFANYGLRPAESAAIKPCDIMFADTYSVVHVSSQARGKVLDHTLKNEYSRRPVIISYWGTQLLKQCVAIIGDNYPHEDNQSMNDAETCAARVKALLIECGASEAILDQIAADVEDDDLDSEDLRDNHPEMREAKIACYVLRRIFASNARSTMGLFGYVTDRLMGHKPIGANGQKEPAVLNVDLNSPDTQRFIAECMERYVFDPTCTLNPFYSPILITDQENLILREFSAYRLQNHTDQEVVLNVNLEAAEAGESITINLPNTSSRDDLTSHSKPKPWMGHERLVIGDTTIPGKEDPNEETKGKRRSTAPGQGES